MPPGQATDRNTPMTRWHGLKRLWRSDVHSMFEISQDFGSRVAEGPHVPAPGAQNAAGGSTQWGPRPARAGSPGLLAASPSRPAFKNVQLHCAPCYSLNRQCTFPARGLCPYSPAPLTCLRHSFTPSSLGAKTPTLRSSRATLSKTVLPYLSIL